MIDLSLSSEMRAETNPEPQTVLTADEAVPKAFPWTLVWFGALLVALRKNMSLEEAGKFANRAAADCCTALGASAGVKNFDDTLARL